MNMIRHFAGRLGDRIQAGLPGVLAHRQMAPTSRPLIDFREHDYPNAKKGSVLILFYPHHKTIYMVLIKRPDYEGVHSGQVAFPGGKVEAGETPQLAAVREAVEEVGVDENKIQVFSGLSNIYIPPSNFFVFPFLAYTEQRPDFRPDPVEVEYLIETPVDVLLDQTIKGSMEIKRGEEVIIAPYYDIQNHQVWGATAIFMSELEFLLTEMQI